MPDTQASGDLGDKGTGEIQKVGDDRERWEGRYYVK